MVNKIKIKINEQVEIMKKYKQEYDSKRGPFGENRTDEHFKNISLSDNNEILSDKSSESIVSAD
ncbi:MAG: hypothetical protein A2287_10915 [Candidatus Melainabacteria bacterium RIFOXYA12_FULL_32_12]|nr:MAG: hypothetical protein A2255_10095 [Candidatus Melainabacteria bacterium RIFOXYA2_FULL_32_9]OGI31875.1 MAG: hypothetical protein A2287_10915 [Candidatus Melainabacteria bacterium RIFOXYA12_FULL_32_12]